MKKIKLCLQPSLILDALATLVVSSVNIFELWVMGWVFIEVLVSICKHGVVKNNIKIHIILYQYFLDGQVENNKAAN